METEPREMKRRGGFRDEGEVGGAGKRPRASSPQVPISSDNATANGGIGEGSTGAVSPGAGTTGAVSPGAVAKMLLPASIELALVADSTTALLGPTGPSHLLHS